LADDDATVVGHAVTILETKMDKIDSFVEKFDKTLEVRFRAQAEMLDERFAQVFTEMDRRFAQVFTEMDRRFAQVATEMNRGFTSLQNDITILREGMKVLLERRR
jgi:hypothetical protein